MFYTHGIVNNSKSFKDPVTGVNTKCLEVMWYIVKKNTPYSQANDQ